MTSTFRLLIAAMPEIATACERITDPDLRYRAFDVLVAEARAGGSEVPYDRGSAYSAAGYTATDQLPTSAYLGDTRVDNGAVRG